MKNIFTKLIVPLALLASVTTFAHAAILSPSEMVFGESGTIYPLGPWVSTTTPDNAITQRVFGRPIYITGLTAGQNICTAANGLATTTGCTGGGSVTGSGTAGEVTFWSSSSNITSTSSMRWNNNVGSLGIGDQLDNCGNDNSLVICATRPFKYLGTFVNYDPTGSSNFVWGNDAESASLLVGVGNSNDGQQSQFINTPYATGGFGSDFVLGANNSELIRLASTSKVGIGINNPLYVLDVYGVDTVFRAGNEAARIDFSNADSWPRLTGSQSGIDQWTVGITDLFDTDALSIYTAVNEPIIFGTNNTRHAVLNELGYFGVGTTSPGTPLGITGAGVFTGPVTATVFNATSTVASSTFANGLNITGGCFAVNNVCLSTGGSGTVGSGTTGQYPYYAGSGTTLTATSTPFLTTAGLFGIGTTSPWAKLSVEQNGGNGALFAVGSSTRTAFSVSNGGNVGVGTSSPTLPFVVEYDNNTFFSGVSIINKNTGTNALTGFELRDRLSNVQGQAIWIPTNFANATLANSVTFNSVQSGVAVGLLSNSGIGASNGPIFLQQGNSRRLHIEPGGNIGIGSAADTSADAALEILSTLMVSSAAANDGDRLNLTSTGRFGIGSSTPTAFFSVNPNGIGNIPKFAIGSSTATDFLVDAMGDVGIATTSPASRLAVSQASPTMPFFTVASTTGSNTTELFSIDSKGHLVIKGKTPTVSSCGTSPSISGDDTHGTITVGGGVVTSCTVTFDQAYTATPLFSGLTTDSGTITAGVTALSTTGFTVGLSASLPGGKIYYFIVQ